MRMNRGATVLALALASLSVWAAESSVWLGIPVNFQDKEYTYHSGPAVELKQVQLQTTQPVSITNVWLTPDWSAWFTDLNTKSMRAEVTELTAKPSALARLGMSDGPSSRKITRIDFSRLKLQLESTTLELPAGDMTFNADGTLANIRMPLPDKLQLLFTPKDGKLGITLQSDRLTLPSLPGFVFDSMIAQGVVEDNAIVFDKISTSGDGGAISGAMRIDLTDGAVLSADLVMNSLRAKDVLGRLYPRHVVDGIVSGEIKIKAKAASIVELKAAPVALEGNYVLKAGSIDRFGILEGMRKSDPGVVGGGLVRFESINGKFSGKTGDKATANFTGLNNGALTGYGNFSVAQDSTLAGSVGGTLRLPGGEVISRNLQLSGKAPAPVLSVRR